MKHQYMAPQSESTELMHRDSLMLINASTGSALVKDEVDFEAISKGWQASDWSGEEEEEED